MNVDFDQVRAAGAVRQALQCVAFVQVENGAMAGQYAIPRPSFMEWTPGDISIKPDSTDGDYCWSPVGGEEYHKCTHELDTQIRPFLTPQYAITEEQFLDTIGVARNSVSICFEDFL